MTWPAETPDIMDLSREDSIRRAEDGIEPLFCPFDAGEAIVQWLSTSHQFPWRVFCKTCQCTTPYVTLRAVALSLWNSRVARKPARLVDKPVPPGHTPRRNPRSSGSAKGAGKRATGRKGAQPKSKESIKS